MPILRPPGGGGGGGTLSNGSTIWQSTPQPSPLWQKPTSATKTGVQKVVVLVAAGQSNNEGRGTTRQPEDSDYAGIWQYSNYPSDPNYRVIQPDFTPLNSSNPYAGAGGFGSDRVGPAEYEARAIRALDPATPEVVIVPCAVGGTTLSVNSPPWKSDATPGAGGAYFENMITQTNLAVAAAQAKWPNVTVEVVFSWVQGEFDATYTTPATRAQYYTDLADLISRARARITNAAGAKFLIGSMIPRLWTIGAPLYDQNYANINAAHVDASLNISGVYYSKGPGDNSTGSTDGLHYSPEAFVREQGWRIGASGYDTVGPSVTNPSNLGNLSNSLLATALTHDDPTGHATLHIVGGANAALFEISDPYISPTLRWASNGTGPADGTYSVDVAARDGSGNYGPTKTLNYTVSNEVNPATFFGSGEPGGVYPLTLATLWQDKERTVPVTTAGQVVGCADDTSGNGNHLRALANDSTRPTYQVDSDGKGYLSFDGSNDILVGLPYITTTLGRNTVIIGLLAATPGSVRQPIGSYATTSGVPFMTFQCESTGILDPQMRNDAGNTGGTQPTLSAVFDSTKKLITHSYQGSNGTWRIRLATDRPSDGGASAGYSSVSQGTNSELRTTIDVMSIGGRYANGATNVFMACRIYPFFAIGRFLTDAEVKSGEEWVAHRMLTTALPGESTGPTVITGTGTAAGAGNASASALAIATASGAASGTGNASGGLSATATASGAASGVGNASGGGKGLVTASGAASGAGAASGSGFAVAIGAGSASGLGSASASSFSVAIGSGSAAGVGAGNGQAVAGASSGAASGAGSASASAIAVVIATGTAAGAGNASGSGLAPTTASGAASGAGNAAATGGSTVTASGSASGSGNASAFALAPGTGLGGAGGVGQGGGVGLAVVFATGTAAGAGNASGAGRATTTASGAAAGTGNASGGGQAVSLATGAASGLGTASSYTVQGGAVGAASGAGSASATAIIVIVATGTAAGAGGASAGGVSGRVAAGNAAGVGSGAAGGVTAIAANGNASGVGNASVLDATALFRAVGSAAGVGNGSGGGKALTTHSGSASGAGSAQGGGAMVRSGTGSAAGTGNASGAAVAELVALETGESFEAQRKATFEGRAVRSEFDAPRRSFGR